MKLPVIADIYRSYKNATVSEVIHPNDSMYNVGAGHYYIVGESAIDVILPGLILSSIHRVVRVLDLACGYGRVARHLRAAFPQCELLFCDLVHEGAKFCASTFGGTTIEANADLTKIALPRDLDIIWIGSLFTHVDRVRTANWLAFLADHLCEGGNIVATFHGYFSEKVTDFGERYDQAKLSREFFATGYGYCCADASQDYGVSLAKPSTILDIADSIPNTKVLAYTERGWANNHDVLTLNRSDRLKPWGAK